MLASHQIICEPPRPLNCSKASIIRFGEEVGDRIGYTPGLATAWSLLHSFSTWRGWDDAYGNEHRSVVAYPNKTFQVGRWSTLTPARELVNAAQAIGHVLLHFPGHLEKSPEAWMVVPRVHDETDEDARQAAFEAIWFSFGLLAPTKALHAFTENTDTSSTTLAQRLGVTERFAGLQQKRILSLGA